MPRTQHHKKSCLIAEARLAFHDSLLSGALTVDFAGVPSIADKDNRLSTRIAQTLVESISTGTARVRKKAADQRAGLLFEAACAQFLSETFLYLGHLRCGRFEILHLSQGDQSGVARFEQYSHLADLARLAKEKSMLATAIGTDYLICPDIVVFRHPEPDETINQERKIINKRTAELTGLRINNNVLPLLHASVSCKWTMRSDRAQNARAEALNLVRNRKGRTPHVVVVTSEPLPSRLSSLALGTGDIDCVYHFALPELRESVRKIGADDANELLEIMVCGKRLRDISDLPLDLAI